MSPRYIRLTRLSVGHAQECNGVTVRNMFRVTDQITMCVCVSLNQEITLIKDSTNNWLCSG